MIDAVMCLLNSYNNFEEGMELIRKGGKILQRMKQRKMNK
jgi:exonuclease VII small subunit